MKTTYLILSIPLLLLSAAGCTSDELQDKPITNEKGEYAINFNGNMDLTLTKATATDVATGVKAMISAYTSGADVTSAQAIVSKGYTVESTAGTFVGDTEGSGPFVMYLPKGDYDFYAVSTNSTTAAPTFTSGVSAVLSNGVDYIYAKPTPATTVPTTTNVTLAFQRKAVLIEIKVKGSDADGLELTGWQSSNPATITPPVTTGCTMALATGIITPAGSIDTDLSGEVYKAAMTTVAVATNESTATYTMLPVATDQTLKVKFKVKVKIGGRDAEDKTYTADLKAPNNSDNGNTTAFLSGKKYTYNAILKANKITFTGATVADWGAVTGSDPTVTEP